MEITEVKYEWIIGEFTARTFVGDYGVHTDWFKNDEFIDSNSVDDVVPDSVYTAWEELCEKEGF